MQHEMPQSLLVFAVSFTPKTPNFGTFGEDAITLMMTLMMTEGGLQEFLIFLKFLLLSVYMHIFEI